MENGVNTFLPAGSPCNGQCWLWLRRQTCMWYSVGSTLRWHLHACTALAFFQPTWTFFSMQELCTAFIMSKSSLIKGKNAQLLVKLAKGIPGLLARLVCLVSDRLYSTCLSKLVKSVSQATGGWSPDGPTPSQYVQLILQSCLDLVLSTEDNAVVSLLSGVCSLASQPEAPQSSAGLHMVSMPLALAASIAQTRHSFFSIEGFCKAQVCMVIVQ